MTLRRCWRPPNADRVRLPRSRSGRTWGWGRRLAGSSVDHGGTSRWVLAVEQVLLQPSLCLAVGSATGFARCSSVVFVSARPPRRRGSQLVLAMQTEAGGGVKRKRYLCSTAHDAVSSVDLGDAASMVPASGPFAPKSPPAPL